MSEAQEKIESILEAWEDGGMMYVSNFSYPGVAVEILKALQELGYRKPPEVSQDELLLTPDERKAAWLKAEQSMGFLLTLVPQILDGELYDEGNQIHDKFQCEVQLAKVLEHRLDRPELERQIHILLHDDEFEDACLYNADTGGYCEQWNSSASFCMNKSPKDCRKIIKLLALFPEGEPPNRPKIVCLCGSTRFKEAYYQEYARLSDAGNIVLSVSRLIPDHRDNQNWDFPEQEAVWHKLHLRKIDLADEIFVLNVNGYIGESLKKEIAYAEKLGKPIRYLE